MNRTHLNYPQIQTIPRLRPTSRDNVKYLIDDSTEPAFSTIDNWWFRGL